MAGEFWLSDRQWSVLQPLLPTNQPGARRVDDRRMISGIVHMLRNGGRWQVCPPCYGPPTTVYNPFPPLVRARPVDGYAGRPVAGDPWRVVADRQHHGQGAPLGRRRQGGLTARP